MAAIGWSSPPNPSDYSGGSVGSESGDGSRKTSQILTVVFSLFGTFFLIFLVITWAKYNRRKKDNNRNATPADRVELWIDEHVGKKAVPIDLGVVKNDEYDNNRNATPTDRVELWIDEHVGKKASLVTGFDQLNKNNKKTATSSNTGGAKLNIEKHGKNDKKEAKDTTSNIRVDELNIDKRGKNKKKEAEAAISDVRVDQLNINKRGKNDKNKAEASTSYVIVDQLNINKRNKNHKKEAEATTSNVRVDQLNIDKEDKKEAETTTPDLKVDQLNIDKRGKNNKKETKATTSEVKVDQLHINKCNKNHKKEAEVTTSNVRVDQLNIDKCNKNDKKEAKTTTSDLKIDQLNMDKPGKNNKKETKATTSEVKVKVDQFNIDMRAKDNRKETKTTDSYFRVNKLNIDEYDKKTKKKKAKATTPSDVKYGENDKEEATISDVEFDEDKLNINVHEKKKLKKGHLEKVAKLIQKVDEQKPRRYTAEDLKAITSDEKNRVGAGSFGDVYKGKSPDGVDIAVKVLKNWGNSNTTTDKEKLAAEQFMAEVESIYNTHHINVIRLLGFCYEDEKVDNSKSTIALVFEYMENGSLDNYLSGKKDELEFEKLFYIAIGTAKGLAYLHEDCPKKMVHFDIKPANILLDSKFTPKVCDFGLAKLCNRDDTHFSVAPDQMGGTFGYIAPEVWASNRRVTNKCDVYSFGIVLFKMVEVKRQNKNNNNNENDQDWFPICVRDAASKNELELFIGRDCNFSGDRKDKAIRACKVGLWCTQDLPSSRPLMSQVVRMLEGADPINLPQPLPFQKHYPISTLKKNRKGFKVPGCGCEEVVEGSRSY